MTLPNACGMCGDCYHPSVGPNTDGEPCDYCRDCGCPSREHARMVAAPAPRVALATPHPCSHGVDPARCVEHRVTGDLFATSDEEQAQ